ncbi:conjugative transfer system coupling protein TraD [Pseudovibrio sp. Ad37]|uniref:conjugative transfer system coupling protein TraD n=1 Tax=Pseudovibrio sp. Ad37 TaxID=989422 RepID=UPI0007B2E11F|nr:conjugative transfer system coupling protein TraD [Pseudovibrio sp. Ad37]KZL22697.1 Type IV secretion-system coupling protein DNA-binding domain protein [Pseudovibrio sp. Ad37]
MIKYNPTNYEVPWRPNYEMWAISGWASSSALALMIQQVSKMPEDPFYWMAGICGAMGLARLPAAWRLNRLQKNLGGRPFEYINFDELQKKMGSDGAHVWYGTGFDWENRHAQRVFEILKRDWATFTKSVRPKPLKLPFTRRKNDDQGKNIGQPWIHGVEPEENDIFQAMSHVEGHTLIIGTTGAGKTRMFDIVISQAIARNEPVVIIDPKGDKEMAQNAKQACIALGQPERFVSFHPAFPDQSVRIDPLKNFTRGTQLASRIAALLPTSGGGIDPFVQFSWSALNNIVQGLLLIHAAPNLRRIKQYLEGGAAKLVERAVISYAGKVLPNGVDEAKTFLKKKDQANDDHRAGAMAAFYYKKLQPENPNSDLEGLLSMWEHDRTHFAKMVSSLLPIMNMLTSGEIGELLSPDPENLDDERPIMSFGQLINNNCVTYLGLDSLTDNMVAQAVGSLMLADLVALAGDRYNYGQDLAPVNVFVDEASEVMNVPFIQLLNKGRGALLRLFVATQTIADMEEKLGSKARAMMVLGNLNNTFALRTIDSETQEYLAQNLPKTRVKYVMRTQGQNTDSNHPILHGGNQGERLMEEEAEIFPSQLMGMLPNLEFIAKISAGRIVKGRIPILKAH